MNYDSEYNKSIFIDLVYYKVESEKVYYYSKLAISKYIVICSIVSIAPRDFLSTFLGVLCYTKQEYIFISDLLVLVSSL